MIRYLNSAFVFLWLLGMHVPEPPVHNAYLQCLYTVGDAGSEWRRGRRRRCCDTVLGAAEISVGMARPQQEEEEEQVCCCPIELAPAQSSTGMEVVRVPGASRGGRLGRSVRGVRAAGRRQRMQRRAGGGPLSWGRTGVLGQKTVR